jgi:hypothetical protein
MKLLQLYIENERVDLFKDESVTITDSIKNVKDIDKIFTSFSQSFSLPASKTNNKIFSHYYNSDIVNGFDARKKVNARIEINNQTFRVGKIKLEGVDLKHNKPHTYRVTFFGNTVELKDVLGEAKLSSLNFNVLNLPYSASNIQAYSTAPVSDSTNIVCPLITHTQRLYYNSTSHNTEDGNLYYDQAQGHRHGVYWNQLKYAIRVNRIIEQIETDYNLQFSSDFFKNTNVREFYNMFMWLHRKSGGVEDLSGGTNSTDIVDGWGYVYRATYSMVDDVLELYGESQRYNNLDLNIYPSNPSDVWSVTVTSYGQTVYQSSNNQGNTFIDLTSVAQENPNARLQVLITASGVISFNNIQWQIQYIEQVNGVIVIEQDTFNNYTFSTSGVFIFNVNRQIPDIKIIDFLSGLFKMFNLSAYIENGTIKVQTLDDYYSQGKGTLINTDAWDITKYVDNSTKKIDVALPFNEIVYKFNDTGTFLANRFSELNNRNWGELNYNQDQNDYVGELYKVEVPFGHQLYERITDAGTQELTNIQWGYSVNESQSAYLGKPLLFYPIRINTVDGISFVSELNSEGVPITHVRLYDVVMPFNTVSENPNTNNFQLNFNNEINEWTLDTTFTNTLFQKYHSNYIVNTFSLKQRITQVTAYLPQSILMNYNLADIFILNGSKYRINKITTNLLTNKSDIELLNEI